MRLRQDEIVGYITGWDSAWGIRIAAGLAGVLLLALVFRLLYRKRARALGSVFGIAAGLAAVIFALVPQRLVDMVISTPYDMRVRIIIGTISVVVLIITLESIRRTHLQERYALLWVGTGIVILVCVLFPRAVVLLRMLTGMRYTQALTAVTFTFLVLVAFHFSISISSSRSNQARMAQRIAILEERLRNLENGGEPSAGGGESPGEKETTDG
jgi:hypothetical protein